jgi:hypothetical protein
LIESYLLLLQSAATRTLFFLNVVATNLAAIAGTGTQGFAAITLKY